MYLGSVVPPLSGGTQPLSPFCVILNALIRLCIEKPQFDLRNLIAGLSSLAVPPRCFGKVLRYSVAEVALQPVKITSTRSAGTACPQGHSHHYDALQPGKGNSGEPRIFASTQADPQFRRSLLGSGSSLFLPMQQ